VNYEPTVSHESTTCPGVTFTVRRFSVGMRVALRKRLDPIFAQSRAIARERGDWVEEVAERLGVEPDKLTVDKLPREDQALFEEFVATEVDLAHFDAGFVAIAGLTIGGETPDSTRLRDEGPPDLVAEILGKIREGFGLTTEQKENLESPTTSAAPVDGQTRGTSAAPVRGRHSTRTATADDTSLDH
jgi:hypothetical protein